MSTLFNLKLHNCKESSTSYTFGIQCAMLKYAILLVFVTVTSGQKYCCFPAQWEASEGLISGSDDGQGHSAVTTGQIKVSYDSTGQRVALNESLAVGNESREYNILQFYKQKVQYIIEKTTCTRAPLGPWEGSCIPDNATVAGKYYLGGKQNILVTDYHWSVGQLDMIMTVTADCVPVTEKTYGNINGQNVMTLVGFLEPTVGIKDPSVFDIPEQCQHARFTNLPPFERRRRSILWK